MSAIWQDSLSDQLYAAVWSRGRVNAPLEMPNRVGCHDYFVFAPESQMDKKYALLEGLVGSTDFPLAERSLWEDRLGSLKHVYHRFFRARRDHIPAFWWLWGRVPIRSLNPTDRTVKRRDRLDGFALTDARPRRAGSHSLLMSNGKTLDVPLRLLRPVERKLRWHLAYRRDVAIHDVHSGVHLADLFHDEIQLGTNENRAEILGEQYEAGPFDLIKLNRTASGISYVDAFAIYLVRAKPLHARDNVRQYRVCDFEALYLSYRMIGCVSKIGVIQGDFNTWAQSHPSLCRILDPFGQGG
jgi:hypothetical protein